MNVARFTIEPSNVLEVETYIKNFLEARRAYVVDHMCNPCQIYLDTKGLKI
jgi:hypothetical protein